MRCLIGLANGAGRQFARLQPEIDKLFSQVSEAAKANDRRKINHGYYFMPESSVHFVCTNFEMANCERWGQQKASLDMRQLDGDGNLREVLPLVRSTPLIEQPFRVETNLVEVPLQKVSDTCWCCCCYRCLSCSRSCSCFCCTADGRQCWFI